MTAIRSGEADRFVARPPTDTKLFLIHGSDAGLVRERARKLLRALVDDPADPFQLIELDGLVIPGLGTPGPVTTVSASLYCGGDANVSPAATTRPANLSSRGDAEISDHVTLPETCLAPIVLIHPNNGLARYIAVTGWRA